MGRREAEAERAGGSPWAVEGDGTEDAPPSKDTHWQPGENLGAPGPGDKTEGGGGESHLRSTTKDVCQVR